MTQDAPRHRQREVESHVMPHDAAVPHEMLQSDEPLHVTPHEAALPQSTAHGALSRQVTPHEPLSSHATSHAPPEHVAAHEVASAQSATQLVAEQTHAPLVQRQIPPTGQETSGSGPQATSTTDRASTTAVIRGRIGRAYRARPVCGAPNRQKKLMRSRLLPAEYA